MHTSFTALALLLLHSTQLNAFPTTLKRLTPRDQPNWLDRFAGELWHPSNRPVQVIATNNGPPPTTPFANPANAPNGALANVANNPEVLHDVLEGEFGEKLKRRSWNPFYWGDPSNQPVQVIATNNGGPRPTTPFANPANFPNAGAANAPNGALANVANNPEVLHDVLEGEFGEKLKRRS